jgi:hypothetical protein
MADNSDGDYLIWSHEHSAWWGPGGRGYVRRISHAGRYSHSQALTICTAAIPGTSAKLGALPEVPVRLADLELMIAGYKGRFGERAEAWL